MIVAFFLLTVLIFVLGWLKFGKLNLGQGFLYNLIMVSLVAGTLGLAIVDAYNFSSGLVAEKFFDGSNDSGDGETFDPNQQEGEEDSKSVPKTFYILVFNIVLITIRLVSTYLGIYKKSDVFSDYSDKVEGAGLLSTSKFTELGKDGWTSHLNNINGNGLRNFYVALRNISQQSIYLICVSTLLYIVANEGMELGLFASVLNFGLFFILDDWQIMHQYSAQSDGDMLKNHRRKNWAVNILLVVSCALVLLGDVVDSEVALYDRAINLGLIVLLLLFVLWRKRSDFNVYQENFLAKTA